MHAYTSLYTLVQVEIKSLMFLNNCPVSFSAKPFNKTKHNTQSQLFIPIEPLKTVVDTCLVKLVQAYISIYKLIQACISLYKLI